MSQSLPTLFRHAGGYRRQLTFTPGGVIAEESADDPTLTEAIRAHAREVTGFVQEGMPAMMQQMVGPGGMMGGMGCGGMMGLAALNREISLQTRTPATSGLPTTP